MSCAISLLVKKSEEVKFSLHLSDNCSRCRVQDLAAGLLNETVLASRNTHFICNLITHQMCQEGSCIVLSCLRV